MNTSFELVNAKTGEILELGRATLYCQECLETLKIVDANKGLFEPCQCKRLSVGFLFSHGERAQ